MNYFNKSVLTGIIYLSVFKKCLIIPLLKTDDKLSCGYYPSIPIVLT